MGRLDNVKRVVKSDYDTKYHDLIDKLAFVLNSFMEQVVTEMNGCLDFENLDQDITIFKITVDSCGVPTGNDQVRTNVSNPQGLLVIKVEDTNNPDLFATTQPFIKFVTGTSAQVIKIQQITGLTADRPYKLTVVSFG